MTKTGQKPTLWQSKSSPTCSLSRLFGVKLYLGRSLNHLTPSHHMHPPPPQTPECILSVPQRPSETCHNPNEPPQIRAPPSSHSHKHPQICTDRVTTSKTCFHEIINICLVTRAAVLLWCPAVDGPGGRCLEGPRCSRGHTRGFSQETGVPPGPHQGVAAITTSSDIPYHNTTP